MLFKEKLNYYDQIVSGELDGLLKAAFQSQSHYSDLLLLKINGFYSEEVSKVGYKPMSPFVFGPGSIGHSESLHNDFIYEFGTSHTLDVTYADFRAEREYPPNTEWSEELSTRIEVLVKQEAHVIQTEMLVYIKIWESALYLKNLYQLVRLLKGQHYDWFFKLKTANTPDGIASAQKLIRVYIRDDLRSFSPVLADLIGRAYKSQIRNSIAHSNYSMLGRNIHPNNSDGKYANIQSLHFDEWVEMFHISIVLYNAYNRMKNQIEKFYVHELPVMDHYIDLRFTDKDGIETQYPIFHDEIRGWCWFRP